MPQTMPPTNDKADALAARLRLYVQGTPHMDSSVSVSLPKYLDKPGQVGVTLPYPVVTDLLAAAVMIEGLR